MKVLGVIPARYGSTRLEGKPLIDLCGKPMIQLVYEQVKKSLEFVVVATDDKRIFDVVNAFGGNVVMTSPNHNTGTNRCLEAYEVFSEQAKIDFDVVINIQGDEPLLDPKQLEQLVSCFEDKTAEMATLIIPVKENESLETGVFVVKDNQMNALYFSRSVIPFIRDAEKTDWTKTHTFYKHIGMYGFKPNALVEFSKLAQTSLELAESLEQNRWLENGKKIKVAITEIHTVGVDTPEDVEKVRKLLSEK